MDNNRFENTELLPGLSIQQLSGLMVEILMSDEIDAKGEKNGIPLFERYEDRKRPGTDIEGIIPVVTRLLPQKIESIRVDREHRYPNSNNRCDFVLTHLTGKELWIELKLTWTKPCTPYDSAYSNKELISDIEKYNELSMEKVKAIMQLSYESTSEFPEDSIKVINDELGDAPFVWNKFDMQTKTNGDCFCHVFLWVVENSKLGKIIEKNSHFEAEIVQSDDTMNKTKAIESIVPYLDEKCGSNGIYRFYKPEQKKGINAYYGYFIQKRGSGWILVCWSDEFETRYGVSPFWIEFDEKPASKLSIKDYPTAKDHPSKIGRKIIPIAKSEINNPKIIAEKVYKLALDTLL
ncbi:MAG: hypothetical protein J7M24_04780 [Candidatus Latescibacteria bacterium]|nr:hypothetical protein [Candidatus Latescibacterota bacterium]